MKKSLKTLLAVLLAAVMLFTLCACGNKEPADPNLYKFGDYTLLYKGACIMYSEYGEDALVLNFDFTNNSKSAASMGWTIFETCVQDGTELESVYVITDMETYSGVAENYFIDAEPGETLEVGIGRKLNGMGEVTVTLSDLLDKYVYNITIDPSTLERVENEYNEDSDWSDWGFDDEESEGEDSSSEESSTEEPSTEESSTPVEEMTASFTDWWEGDWYGWWFVSEATGEYEEYVGNWWDACAKITMYSDLTGYFEMWDDASPDRSELTSEANVSFTAQGEGEHGSMVSESGQFMGDTLEPAEWVIDPAQTGVENMIVIEGVCESETGSYNYILYLRPWGMLWDDAAEDDLPYSYDWYLAFVEAGAAMPDSFEEPAPTVG